MGVQSVALATNPANAAVVLAAVLGSRVVEMLETQSSITPGSRASRLAKVACREICYWVMHVGVSISLDKS